MSVDRVRVGDVLQLERRVVEVDPNEEYEEIGIRSFGRGIFHKEPVTGAVLGTKRVFRIEPGDLVISNVFAWEGAIALASTAEAGRIGSHRFMTFTSTDGRVDAGWATWLFRSEAGLELIRGASPGSAGRNRTLAIDRFLALEIPLPSIAEQLQHVARLDAVRDVATRASDNLQGGDAFTSLLPVLIDAVLDQTAAGGLRVDEAADFISDTVHPGDDPGSATSFVGLQHIEGHTGRCIGSDPLGTMKGRKFRFRPGDVLYGYLRPYLNKVWVADRHGLCSVDQYVLRPRPGVDGPLLGHCLRGRRVLAQAIELTHNLQLPRLRSGLLGSLAVPLLGTEDTRDIVVRLDQVRDQVVELAAKRTHQTQLIAALVPSALNQAFASLS